MKKDRAIIRCKWCKWWRYVWIGRKGRSSLGPYHAWEAMEYHMQDDHPQERHEIALYYALCARDSIKYDSMAPLRRELPWYETYKGGLFDHCGMHIMR